MLLNCESIAGDTNYKLKKKEAHKMAEIQLF